jgi:formamidopyrimidine-DNA glycosylase
LVNLGVEPLSDEFTPDYLYNNLKKRSGPIKNAIMNNKIVVGIGNIYAAESLFLSGISPLRAASAVTRAQCAKMVKIIKEVLKRSIEAGGTTISDYKQVDGSEGKFVQQLKIYGKDGQPCPECNAVIRKAVLGGRSSCFCPICQK